MTKIKPEFSVKTGTCAEIHLRYNPYTCFTTIATPFGLYARQKWLGQEKNKCWQYEFESIVASLLKGQLEDGSWDNSFLKTVQRLFGLHLTVRNQTTNINRALDWLLSHIKHPDTNKDRNEAGLAGLPFVSGSKYFLYTGMFLFLAAIFGRGGDPSITKLYKELSHDVLQDANIRNNHRDITNIFRAFVVHPVYSMNPATELIVKILSEAQDNSGMWIHTIPLYKTVNALAHLNLPLADKQLEKAFPLLAQTQNPDGTWGDVEKEWNTFLIVHAMRNKKMLK